ncbi:MAG TPA: hypothetical protein PL190_03325 [Caldisericia bacterium]|jgi:hypothetical protein|nr:MAG: hypothetical protein BWX90_01091 [bacterium ADurb.Bin132]HNY61183.1 hypothetical protein [Caldisericia bacterium]HOC79155.1 hypothetical protein [Caldisericia bacterium]HOG70194.1 hypothetical protein [Caldisericia bacterium]HPA65550.1 hypothetical protein [Caldisericia bacterium]
MSLLFDIGIVKKKDSKTENIFETLVSDFRKVEYTQPSDYIVQYWNIYKNKYNKDNVAINGKIFELCLATLFIRENLLPFYMQARVAFVPNVNYDFILYTLQLGPIAISAKTTLRERYKQADLEAVALKYVHRKSKCYLITLDEPESRNVNKKITNGGLLGLDQSICALNNELDGLIKHLKEYNYSIAPKVDIVESSILITQDKIDQFK